MATPVTYIIFLTNAAQVLSLQTTYPNGIQIPPATAAAIYGIPGPGVGTDNLNATGGIGIYPEDSVGWLVDLSPSYGTQTFTVTYPDQSPPPATWPNPYPVSVECFWLGRFLLTGQPGTTPPPGSDLRYLGARRWCEGFEVSGANGGNRYARDASRTPEGMGFPHRNTSGTTTQTRVTNPTGGTRPSLSWERFYIRLRTLPTADDNMWSTTGSVEGGTSLLMYVSSTGTLKVYSKGNAAYPGELLGTTAALTVGTWYRIDMRFQYETASLAGTLKLYINGVLSFTGTGVANQGLGTVQLHAASFIGRDSGTTNNGLECDIDDWISADEVSITVGGVTTGYPGVDLTSGSHVELVRPAAFATDHNTTAWLGVGTAVSGDVREINHNPGSTAGATAGLTSTTVSAVMSATSNYKRTQWGVAAVGTQVFLTSSPAGTITFTLVSDLGTVTRTNANAASATWLTAQNLYSVPSGSTVDALPDLGTLVMKFTSVSGVGTTTIPALFAQAEHIGFFGPEDTPSTSVSTYLPRIGLQNSSYPNLHASNSQVGPITAVRVSSGTYIGNNIGQDVFAQIGANWFFARALSGSSSGVWHTGMVAAHSWMSRKFSPENMAQAQIDANNIARLQVTGSGLIANQNAATYQWIAVSDYAMRFFINGAFAHASALASSVNSLVDPLFTPDGVFFYIGDLSTTTNSHYYKGPGHTGTNASRLDTSESAVASFAAGTITSLTAIHTDAPETAFSAWRKSDGSAAPAWVDMTSYTGNGAGGTRDIAVALNGRSPLFAIVVPHNGSSFLRDASHTSTNSVQISNGSNSTTAIVGGGANKITVGTALNTNLIVYDVFVIGGETAAGWSSNGTYTAAVETQRANGPWSANPAAVAITPVTINVPVQWRVHRFDMKPRSEERS